MDKRFSGGLSFLGSYTWAKSLDYVSASFGGGGTSPDNAQNPRNIRDEYGPSAQDLGHRFVVSYIYELPFGQGKTFGSSASRLLNAFIGGWQVTGVTVFQTGLPNTILVGQDRCNCDRAGRMRGSVVPGQDWKLSNPTPERWFNTDAFRLPDPFSFGDVGRSTIRNPGFNNFDFSVLKNFTIREGHALQFRAEFFNLFNHTNFGAPQRQVDNRNFGRISSAFASREIQFGLRYRF